MTQAPELVPPARAVWRARGATAAVALVAAALIFWAGWLGADNGMIPLVIVAWIIILLMPYLADVKRFVLHDDGDDEPLRFLTASTLTGWRTLDLCRLVKIRRLRVEVTPTGSLDLLLLVDANGVRLIVDEPEVDDAIILALEYQEGAEPRVSKSAAYRLGLIDPGFGTRARMWFLGAFVGPLVYMVALFFGVVAASTLVAGLTTPDFQW